MRESAIDAVPEEGGKGGTEDGATERNPGIVPMGTSLVWNGQESMGKAWSDVARSIERIACR